MVVNPPGEMMEIHHLDGDNYNSLHIQLLLASIISISDSSSNVTKLRTTFSDQINQMTTSA